MNNTKGFTLIELIIVIVILGILAVVAAPQFVNFSSDARNATMKGVKSSVQGAGELLHAKALIGGLESQATATAEGVDLVYGYPAATATGIQAAMNLSTEITVTPVPSSVPPAIAFMAQGFTYEDTDPTLQCQVVYTEPSAAGTKPTVVEELSGC